MIGYDAAIRVQTLEAELVKANDKVEALRAIVEQADRANDAIQDWANAHPDQIPDPLDRLLHELDFVINGP